MGDDDSHQGQRSDPVANFYKRPDAAPSPARMIEVASGRSQWTVAEKAWIALHPKWIEHELKTRAMLKVLDGRNPPKSADEDVKRDGFSNRITPSGDEHDRNGPAR